MMSDLDTNLLNFIKSLEHSLNSMVYGKVDKAISMFKRERNLLYITRESDAISAVIKSQSHPYELEYAIKLNSDGSFFCGTQNLRPCGGLRGQICKHIILALIAVIKSKEATPNELIEWVKKSDFFEGRAINDLTNALRQVLEGGSKILGLAALGSNAEPYYNREYGKELNKLGIDVLACTPEKLSETIAHLMQ